MNLYSLQTTQNPLIVVSGAASTGKGTVVADAVLSDTALYRREVLVYTSYVNKWEELLPDATVCLGYNPRFLPGFTRRPGVIIVDLSDRSLHHALLDPTFIAAVSDRAITNTTVFVIMRTLSFRLETEFRIEIDGILFMHQTDVKNFTRWRNLGWHHYDNSNEMREDINRNTRRPFSGLWMPTFGRQFVLRLNKISS